MANKFNFGFMDAKAGDALFSSEPQNISSEDIKNKIVELPIADLVEYHNHTFKVKDDEDMDELVTSIKENGVITPLTVRKKDDKYEIIAGHRRKFASERAGLDKLPCVVLDIDDNAADILMVDSNFQREHILPSEKAFSYKVKMDALNRQGKRTDLENTESIDSMQMISDDSGDSKSKIKRYIRLTYLKPELLDLIDEDKMKISAGYYLSYATSPAQSAAYDAMQETGKIINTEMADRIRALSTSKKKVSKEFVISMLTGEEKKAAKEPKPAFNEKAFKDLIPKEIRKLSPDKRINYHRRALEVYAAYVEQHPDELENL